MTHTKNIIIVNDGAYQWGADRDQLKKAMEKLGWEFDGTGWTEPENEDETEEYTALCNIVSPVEGFGPDDDFESEDYPGLYLSPAPGNDYWTVVE